MNKGTSVQVRGRSRAPSLLDKEIFKYNIYERTLFMLYLHSNEIYT